MTIYPTGPQDSVEYELVAPDGSRASFNDPADSDYVGMARFTGLDSADIRESIEDRAGADGAVQGMNLRGRRPVVANIEIVATTATERNQKVQKLRRAANALRANALLKFTPDGGIASQVSVRLNGPIRRGDEAGWLQKYQVPLMAADPYIYSQTLRSGNGTTNAVTLTNQGDGPAYPTISAVISGTKDVYFDNQTTGGRVKLAQFPAANYGIAYSGQITEVTTTGAVAVHPSSGDIYIATNAPSIKRYNSAGVLQATYPVAQQIMHLTVDSSGNMYFTSAGSNQVFKYNSAGANTLTFGSTGSADGQFVSPTGIAVDGSGNIYVNDFWTGRCQKFNSSGTFVAKLATGTQSAPMGLHIDGSAQLWSADQNNNRILRLNTTTLAVAANFGAAGSEDGQFGAPVAIQSDASGNLYIVDSGNYRVQKVTSAGSFLTKFGSAGSGDGQFSSLFYGQIARNPGGTELLVNGGGGRVQRFSLTGNATVELNFDLGTAKSGGINIYRYVDLNASDWWALQPDGNSVLVTGAVSWTASWRDTWL